MQGVADGTVAATPLEAALIALAKQSVDAPALLTPAHLEPLRRVAGDGAVTYVLVLGSFHFINRIADLLGVDPEVPGMPWLRRIEPLRRALVRMMALLVGRMDLRTRAYARSADEALALLPSDVDRTALAGLRSTPQAIEMIALAVAERDQRSSLDRATLARVHAVVEDALPRTADDVQGFHVRPTNPVDAFAFVGTRYAQRTTVAMIDALRARGFDDVKILDLAIAVADANQWARMWRLLGLPPSVFSVAAV